jgi:hypothetical protein
MMFWLSYSKNKFFTLCNLKFQSSKGYVNVTNKISKADRPKLGGWAGITCLWLGWLGQAGQKCIRVRLVWINRFGWAKKR